MANVESSEAGSARLILWIALALITVTGIVVAIVTSSGWPLIAFAGLALHMIPVRSSRPRK